MTKNTNSPVDLSAWMVDETATKTKDIKGIPATFRTSIAGKDVKGILINSRTSADVAERELEFEFALVELVLVDPVISREDWMSGEMDSAVQIEIVIESKIIAGLIDDSFR